MMEHLENIQVTLAAGESSPRRGPLASGAADPNITRTCPDCGTIGSGTYCSLCGEVLEPKLPPVHHYLKEFLHDLLALDSKLVRTVPALLFRPGFLTQEYIAGRRKRYLIPSRLYLLTAFLVFFALGSYLHNEGASLMSNKSSHVTYSFRNVKIGDVKDEDARPYIQKLLSLAITVSPYVILLGSTPLFALILKVLYRKKKRLFVEHLVFAFHLFAFALPVLVAGTFISPKYGALASLILFMVYLFIAMRRVYHDRGAGLVFRFAVSTFSYFGIAMFAIVVSIVAGYAMGVYAGDLPDIRNSHGGFPGPVLHDTIFKSP